MNAPTSNVSIRLGPRSMHLVPPEPVAFNVRCLAELSIEVMRCSIAAERADGSPSPSVGAVLYRPDRPLVCAARGEIRAENHAEFQVIERQCIADCLAGATLFTTLEPCLNRTFPKRGCARHIVSARIAQVYIGLVDPNPAVDGAGIAFLRKNGVTVHMFDLDLQEVILRENAKYLVWAMNRKLSCTAACCDKVTPFIPNPAVSDAAQG